MPRAPSNEAGGEVSALAPRNNEEDSNERGFSVVTIAACILLRPRALLQAAHPLGRSLLLSCSYDSRWLLSTPEALPPPVYRTCLPSKLSLTLKRMKAIANVENPSTSTKTSGSPRDPQNQPPEIHLLFAKGFWNKDSINSLSGYGRKDPENRSSLRLDGTRRPHGLLGCDLGGSPRPAPTRCGWAASLRQPAADLPSVCMAPSPSFILIFVHCYLNKLLGSASKWSHAQKILANGSHFQMHVPFALQILSTGTCSRRATVQVDQGGQARSLTADEFTEAENGTTPSVRIGG